MRRVRILPALLAAAATGWGSTIEYVEGGGARAAVEALSYLGVPYRLGGTDRGGVDCSGLVYAVYRAVAAAELPRTVAGQIGRGERVEGGARAGDLLFFDTTGGPSHVGIALDGERFVHAASEGPATGVIVSSIQERYYRDRFLEARRLLAPGAGRFVIRLDGEPVRATLAYGVEAGSPLEFAVARAAAAAGDRDFVTVRAALDGRQMLERRLRVPAGGAGASVWLVAGPGRWTVSVDSGGRVLAELAFEAGGRP